jgi:hypothetical protein
MDQTEQLRKLIGAAMEKGYQPPWDGEWNNNDRVVWDTHGDPWPVEVLLFGDSLDFLKSLVGDRHEWINVAKPPFVTMNCSKCQTSQEIRDVFTDCYVVVAKNLIELRDEERISWLYRQVIGGDS